MTEATFKRSSAPTNSVAFQYLREQVARQMAGVYSASGITVVHTKKAAEPQPRQTQALGKHKDK